MATSKYSKSLFLEKVIIPHTACIRAQRKSLYKLEDSKRVRSSITSFLFNIFCIIIA